MRRGNLPDVGNDKVTWKRNRDLLKRRRDNITPRRGRDVPLRRYWVFHLGVTEDVVDGLMGLREYIPLRQFGDVPLRRRCVFI